MAIITFKKHKVITPQCLRTESLAPALERPVSDSDQENEAPEIEITPAMMEAGAEELLGLLNERVSPSIAEMLSRQYAESVYRAMASRALMPRISQQE